MSKKNERGVQLKRWLTLLDILSEHGGKMRKSDIHHHLDDYEISVSAKTIERDLTALEELGFIEAEYFERTLDSEKPRKTGFYSFDTQNKEIISKFMKLSLTEDVLKALFLGKEMFRLFEGTSFHAELQELYGTTKRIFSQNKKYHGLIQDAPILTKTGPRRHITKEQSIGLDDILYAIGERKKIQLHEYAFECYPKRSITLAPCKIIQYKDSFYLLAVNTLGKLRLYNLIRYTSLEVLHEDFEAVDTSEFEKRLYHSFGIFVYGPQEKVSILFHSSVAKAIKERVWHPTATVSTSSAGVLLSMDVLVNEELASWIRSWGKSILHIEPRTLADLVTQR